ncbi:MAG: hypothetical protein HKN47_28035, partial [Pirellulaceae bacterium]|nr:hypothetical protein [Pirellulaceae bacterium]
LFDLQSDPDETVNIAGEPEHAERVAEMRSVLKGWMIDTKDMGLLPEAEMHRRCDGVSPREYALSGKVPFERVANLAFDGLGNRRLNDAGDLQDPDSGIRFWAVRALGMEARHCSNKFGNRHPKCQVMVRQLESMMQDESPSVAIVACDALLSVGDAQAAKSRLVELADVTKVGHFAAIAALNVLDMNAQLDAETIAAMKKLPRSTGKPPVRMGAYVGKLLNHALKTSDPAPKKKPRRNKKK